MLFNEYACYTDPVTLCPHGTHSTFMSSFTLKQTYDKYHYKTSQIKGSKGQRVDVRGGIVTVLIPSLWGKVELNNITAYARVDRLR